MIINVKDYLDQMVGVEMSEFFLNETPDDGDPGWCINGPRISGASTLYNVLRKLGWNVIDVNEHPLIELKQSIDGMTDLDFVVVFPDQSFIHGHKKNLNHQGNHVSSILDDENK